MHTGLSGETLVRGRARIQLLDYPPIAVANQVDRQDQHPSGWKPEAETRTHLGAQARFLPKVVHSSVGIQSESTLQVLPATPLSSTQCCMVSLAFPLDGSEIETHLI